MPIILKEGEVGWAPPTEILEYQGVTSCITVTCVTSSGGKAGAHLSIIKKGDGLAYQDVLPALKLVLGASYSDVRKVFIVGQLTTWRTNFEPAMTQKGSNDPDAIKQTEDESKNAAVDYLKRTLQLQHLNNDYFQFIVLEGTFSFPTGGNAEAINLESDLI